MIPILYIPYSEYLAFARRPIELTSMNFMGNIRVIVLELLETMLALLFFYRRPSDTP